MSADRRPPVRGPGSGAAATIVEPCDRCGRETPHDVFVHLFAESARDEAAKFSREPYRVSVCTVCNGETLRRMNDA